MSNLWDVIAHLGIELHPDKIDYLAKRIRKISSAVDLTSTSFREGLNVDHETVLLLKNAWEDQTNITPSEVAVALKSASVTAAHSVVRQGSVELVWTGPATGMVPIRHTEQVLNEVIDTAQHKVFIVSFVAYKVPSIILSLQKAIKRQVKVEVLLEMSSQYGGRVSHDSLKEMRRLLPSANFYTWEQPGKLSGIDEVLGAVHAKCALSDGKVAFITSANLSKAAMEKNMELGILLKEGKLPQRLNLHLEALKTKGTIKLL